MRWLLIMLIAATGCKRPPAAPPAAAAATTAPAGMTQYKYLAADGGPHMLLPAEVSGGWKGASAADVMNPKSDYGRACAAVTTASMALIPVGATSAMILNDPPMSSFGTSADGLVEVYSLQGWTTTNLDALIGKASASLTTSAMTDTRKVLTLSKPDAFLLYAGDTPTSSAYGVYRVPIAPNRYRILTGTYTAGVDRVIIYRLQPQTSASTPASQSAQ